MLEISFVVTYMQIEYGQQWAKKPLDDVSRCQCKPDSARGVLCATDRCNLRATQYECDKDSHGSEGVSCVNRRVQVDWSAMLRQVEVRPQGDVGLGLVAAHSIPAGAFVCPYAGRISQKHRGEYVIELALSDGRRKKVRLDALYVGSVARFANHSSSHANCQLRTWCGDVGCWIGMHMSVNSSCWCMIVYC